MKFIFAKFLFAMGGGFMANTTVSLKISLEIGAGGLPLLKFPRPFSYLNFTKTLRLILTFCIFL